MQPAPQVSPDESHQLRQQLILAQVRLLELEDIRDALASRLALLERTLNEAQALAVTKIAERDQAGKQADTLGAEIQNLSRELTQALARNSTLADEGTQAAAAMTRQREQLRELEARLHAIKSSRSWRWSAPLRSIERLFRRSSG